jgi:hypothetical protein
MMQTGSRTLVVTDILQVVLIDTPLYNFFIKKYRTGFPDLPPENAGQLYSLIQYDVPIICFY